MALLPLEAAPASTSTKLTVVIQVPQRIASVGDRLTMQRLIGRKWHNFSRVANCFVPCDDSTIQGSEAEWPCVSMDIVNHKVNFNLSFSHPQKGTYRFLAVGYLPVGSGKGAATVQIMSGRYKLP
jgi:hypothetical protein